VQGKPAPPSGTKRNGLRLKKRSAVSVVFYLLGGIPPQPGPQLQCMLARFIRSSTSSSISTVHIKSKRGFILVHSFADRFRITKNAAEAMYCLGKSAAQRRQQQPVPWPQLMLIRLMRSSSRSVSSSTVHIKSKRGFIWVPSSWVTGINTYCSCRRCSSSNSRDSQADKLLC